MVFLSQRRLIINYLRTMNKFKKKILITGINSYIGMSFKNYLKKWQDKYSIDSLDMKSDEWVKHDFSQYNTVFHVAGITYKKNRKNKELFVNINCDLAADTASIAKSQGVRQFIFMSSMAVYGSLRETHRVIHRNTVPCPNDIYGYTKLKAENTIRELATEGYKVAVIRSPVIYGPGCKGNFSRLVKLARNVPIFPYIENQRSMIYIENFCEFLRLIIDNDENGLFFPQNSEYVNTSEMVRLLAIKYRHKIKMVKSLNCLVKYLIKKNKVLNKMFSSLIYEKSMSHYKTDYQIKNFIDSILEQ